MMLKTVKELKKELKKFNDNDLVCVLIGQEYKFIEFAAYQGRTIPPEEFPFVCLFVGETYEKCRDGD
jgi:hypothetical protein